MENAWTNERNNIFKNKTDAILYFWIYIVLSSLIMIATSMKVDNEFKEYIKIDELLETYCGIFVSVLGLMADAINRWENGKKSTINLKLIFIIIPCTIALIYILAQTYLGIVLGEPKYVQLVFPTRVLWVSYLISFFDILFCVLKEVKFNLVSKIIIKIKGVK